MTTVTPHPGAAEGVPGGANLETISTSEFSEGACDSIFIREPLNRNVQTLGFSMQWDYFKDLKTMSFVFKLVFNENTYWFNNNDANYHIAFDALRTANKNFMTHKNSRRLDPSLIN